MNQPLDLPTQMSLLLQAYPESLCFIRGRELHWHGSLQPAEQCRRYRVRVLYREGEPVPECYVVDPAPHQLVRESGRPGRPLPHVYRSSGDPLCLFFGKEEWNASMPIACTTIPWISLWIRFFETWLVTDTWEGSGVSPS